LRRRATDFDTGFAQQACDDFALVMGLDQHEFAALRALHGKDVHDISTTKCTKK
jgi:hypothetical protein